MHQFPPASATARKSWAEAAVVDVQTLALSGFPAFEGRVAVAELRDGFAVLDFQEQPCELALDFLPPCRAGDVLRLERHGRQVQIEVDRRATLKAEARLLKLWGLIAP